MPLHARAHQIFHQQVCPPQAHRQQCHTVPEQVGTSWGGVQPAVMAAEHPSPGTHEQHLSAPAWTHASPATASAYPAAVASSAHTATAIATPTAGAPGAADAVA